MITISNRITHQKIDLGLDMQEKFDHIYQMITLSVITLSGFHCKSLLFAGKKMNKSGLDEGLFLVELTFLEMFIIS
jgi:hypothetical protein